jgi:hypothetical protein
LCGFEVALFTPWPGVREAESVGFQGKRRIFIPGMALASRVASRRALFDEVVQMWL